MLILTKLDRHEKLCILFFHICVTYIDTAIMVKFRHLLKILAQHDLATTVLRASRVTVLALGVGSCLKKIEANRSVLCCFNRRKT